VASVTPKRAKCRRCPRNLYWWNKDTEKGVWGCYRCTTATRLPAKLYTGRKIWLGQDKYGFKRNRDMNKETEYNWSYEGKMERNRAEMKRRRALYYR